MTESHSHPSVFVLAYRPGPTWNHGESFWAQPGIDGHEAHLASLLARGEIIMGGPFHDDSGALVALRGVGARRARELADEDPAVQDGTLIAEVREWQVPVSNVQLRGLWGT